MRLILPCFFYRLFPSCTKPLFQSQAKYEAIDMKTIHKNGFAPIAASLWKAEFL